MPERNPRTEINVNYSVKSIFKNIQELELHYGRRPADQPGSFDRTFHKKITSLTDPKRMDSLSSRSFGENHVGIHFVNGNTRGQLLITRNSNEEYEIEHSLIFVDGLRSLENPDVQSLSKLVDRVRQSYETQVRGTKLAVARGIVVRTKQRLTVEGIQKKNGKSRKRKTS